MRYKSAAQTLAIVLIIVGILALFCLFLAVFLRTDVPLPFAPFALAGKFFFDSFSWASVAIPLYFFVSAFLLVARRFSSAMLVSLTLSILPFFTLAILFRLVFGSNTQDSAITVFFEQSFGDIGAAVLLGLLFVLECLLIIRLHVYMNRIPGTGKPRPPALLSFRKPDVASSDQSVQDMILKLPDIPGPPPLRSVQSLHDGSDATEGIESEPVRHAPENYAQVSAVVSYTASESYFEELEEPDDMAESEPENAEPEKDTAAGEADVEEAVLPAAGESAVAVPPDESLVDHLPEDFVRMNASKKRNSHYTVPVDGLLKEYHDGEYWKIDEETQQASEVLRATLEEFKIQADVTGIRKGPVITMFEILPAPGVKLSRITNLSDNIALRLAASSVRIVAPIPGKHAVGIEVPNKKRAIVSFREVISDEAFSSNKMDIPIALGKDIPGETQIIELTQNPHLLIAGATGSGKSVCVNSIICSILYKRSPEEVRLILIDPKIVELKFYNDVAHLLTPVITDPKRAFQALQYCIYEMERRYSLLDALGVRDIRSYNRKIKEKNLATTRLPYIVVIVDEFADLMATTGKELESTLARLAAMSRAVGIHLVLATQRPSIDVITGLIKANIPSRIAFMVASKFDSRIIIDAVGAEKLLGRGDMLYSSATDPFPTRIQGAYLSEEEVEHIVAYIKEMYGEPDYIDDEIFIDEEDEEEEFFDEGGEDPLMDKALEIVVSAGKASASYLQRRLKIGYNRAARLVEDMERRGIVGPQNGSKPRELLHVPDK